MDVKLLNFDIKGDSRGCLISLEQNKNIPFDIKRVYYIFDTKEGVARGFHAHKQLHQVLIAVKGSCKVRLDDGTVKKEVLLDAPSQGLLVDSVCWREMFEFSSDCVLMVLASLEYDEADYIRDYDSFLRYVRGGLDA